MKTYIHFLFFIGLILAFGCGSEEVNLSSDEVFAIRVLDIGNNHNTDDFLVRFKTNNPANIKELRVFIIDPAEFPDFTSSKAAQLPTSSYEVIREIDVDNQITLSPNINDVNGNKIEKDIDYFLGFVVLIEDEVLLNTQIAEAKFTDGHFLDGNFTGTWDDNLYSNFSISTNLTFAGSTLSGPFWYSPSFTSCCGGQDDGSILLNLDGDNITNFTYNQKLVSFMGGACDGTYTGNGKIENFVELLIDFEGDDCEGKHTGGKIRLVKAQ